MRCIMGKTEIKKKRIWPFILLFILGFLIMMYPLVSQYYYKIEAGNEVMEFQDKTKELDKNEILRRMNFWFPIVL